MQALTWEFERPARCIVLCSTLAGRKNVFYRKTGFKASPISGRLFFLQPIDPVFNQLSHGLALLFGNPSEFFKSFRIDSYTQSLFHIAIQWLPISALNGKHENAEV